MTEVTAKRQIRGSGLLLSGRFLSLAINLLTQILIVRYLSKTDYGLFAYALALIETISSINRLGMVQTTARFVPIYEAQNDRASVAGTLLLASGVMAGLGFAIVAMLIGFNGVLANTFVDNAALIHIMVILIALAPLSAFDNLLGALLAAFDKPKIIFLRKYIIGPLLKLAAIGFTILASGDIQTLALAHLFAGIVSFLIYAVLVPRVLREYKLMQYFRPGRFSIDYRRLFRFGTPVFAADSIDIARLVLVIAILEYFHDLASVADYRAVLPIANLNSVALMVFAMLFLPMASRLFAQKNIALLGDVQSQVGLWITCLSFPIFAMCISLAEPIIVLLLGERYASSAPVLTILALGHYFKAGLGLNRVSLRAMGHVQLLLYFEIITTAIVVVAALTFVPGYGAIGGATAYAGAMIFNCFLSTYMLGRMTGENPLPWAYSKIFLLALACALGLWLINPFLGDDPLFPAIALIAISSLLVITSGWKLLRFQDIFPEAGRLFNR